MIHLHRLIAANVRRSICRRRLPSGLRARLLTSSTCPLRQVTREPLKGLLWLIKLVEDYVVASAGPLVSLSVLAVAAIAIRLQGPGPILFRQQRVGFDGKPFMV